MIELFRPGGVVVASCSAHLFCRSVSARGTIDIFFYAREVTTVQCLAQVLLASSLTSTTFNKVGWGQKFRYRKGPNNCGMIDPRCMHGTSHIKGKEKRRIVVARKEE